MCKGSGSTSTTVASSLPPQLAQSYQALLGLGSSVGNLPLQQYQGPQVAGFTPDQTASFNLAEQEPGIGFPFLNQAADWTGAGANPIYPDLQQYNAGNINQFQSPFTQDVIDTTMANIQHYDAEAQNQLRGQGILSGSSPFQGDRAGVAAAELARGQSQARDQIIAQLEQQGFSNAQAQFLAQQQLQSQTEGSDRSRQLNAANQMAGYGNTAQQQMQNAATALSAAGNQQQQLGQQQLNIPYQQFQEQQAYPFKIADFIRQLVTGSQMGQQTTTTTPPNPSLLSQIAGGGLALLGLGSGSLGGGLLKSLFGLKRGGIAGVPHKADGGNLTGGSSDTIRQMLQSIFGGGQPSDDFMSWLRQMTGDGGGAATPPMTTQPAAAASASPAPSPVATQPPVRPLFRPGGGMPHLDPDAVSNSWRYPNSPPGPGYNSGPQTYINALPALHPSDMPPPFVYQMPASVRSALAAFPGAAGATGITGGPNVSWGLRRGGLAAHKDAGGPMGQPTIPTPGLPRGLALMDIGLGIMGGTSPFAGVNIGQGAQAGLKTAMEQRGQLDAGAQIIDDGKTQWIFYPATGEKINLGIPSARAQSWQIAVHPQSQIPYEYNPVTGETRELKIPGMDQYGNPIDTGAATPGQQASNVDPNSIVTDTDGNVIDPAKISSGQKETGVGPTYDSLSPGGQKYAQMLVAGQLAHVSGAQYNRVPAGANAPWGRLVLAANEWAISPKGGDDPSGFSDQTWQARNKTYKEFTSGGSQSPVAQITSANKVIGHLNEMWGEVSNLGNISQDDLKGLPSFAQLFSGPITKGINTVQQWMTAGGGSPKSQSIARYIKARLAVSDELSKFFSGTGGAAQSEIERQLNSVDITAAPADQYAALQTSVRLMESQLRAIEQRWHSSMGKNVQPPGGAILSPESQKILDSVNAWGGTETAAPSGGGARPADPLGILP